MSMKMKTATTFTVYMKCGGKVPVFNGTSKRLQSKGEQLS